MSKDETIEIPMKDLSFFVLKLSMAIELLKIKGVRFNDEEIKEFGSMFKKYIPKIQH